MPFRKNDDWDLCWDDLSTTGCTNSNCSWRHQNSADGFYQQYVHRLMTREFRFEKNLKKHQCTPFDPTKQHQDCGVEDRHYFSHYPDMDKKDGYKKSIQFRNWPGYRQESDDICSFPGPMLMSSLSGGESSLNSISSTILKSQGASDSEDDIVKKDVLDVGQFQNRNSCVFADLHGEVKIPRLSDKPFTSSLSPFAKVFAPRKSRMSKDGISTGLNKMTLENVAVKTIQQCGNLKSFLIENEKVFE